MFSNAVIAVAKLVGFLITIVCIIVSFYAAVHTINVNSQIDLFLGGLLALLIGIAAGPLYCVIAFHGLSHYLAFTQIGATLIVIPVLGAWCLLAYNATVGLLRG